ncbi:hypothetical protein SETIT_4G005900v2 [Setaria italica]|uniref:TF-B3 domain-containing protein n=1 Tax=Setaria italica TaxID=4555 RepID=K3Y2S9_SETIT|nr:B3 domain-containing protein Os06g0107800 [Setaria italica]RCV19812.1 hypothetical protein SETIT_4G005900v2 [Setaria italica]
MALTLALESSSSSRGEGGGDGHGSCRPRESMFEKVVTPSDVGKLNRLVVPKHLAEKHLPLPGAAARAGGTVLCFHDARGGEAAWRFRYSYWSSSQSYVMTKGWSRYVRDKRLAAGDTVSFYRDGARLFIDCRRIRRAGVVPAVPPRQPQQAFFFHNQQQAAVQPQQHLVVAPRVVVVDDEVEEARRRRCLRLFGVNLELELRAEPLLLDLQL